MTFRHKAVKATLDRGYASEWNDDHHFDPAEYVSFHDCFMCNAVTNLWETGQSDAGNIPTVAVVGAAGSGHVFAVLQTTAVVGEISSLRHKVLNAASDVTSPDDLPVLTMAIDLDTPAGAGATHEFGFFANAVVPFAANQDAAFFRVTANVLYSVTGAGAAETTSDLGAPGQYGVYRVEFTSTSVKFYVDDLVTAVATHAANITAADLNIKFSAQAVAAGAQVLRSDFVGLTRLRKN